MEIFGIIFSVPVAFVASVVYCIILVKVVRKHERTSRLLWWASAVVLAGFVVEVILLATMGAVRSRRRSESTFSWHIASEAATKSRRTGSLRNAPNSCGPISRAFRTTRFPTCARESRTSGTAYGSKNSAGRQSGLT